VGLPDILISKPCPFRRCIPAKWDNYIWVQFTLDQVEALRVELKTLQHGNLEQATFNEKIDLIARMGLRVYPSEDPKSRRITCNLNLKNNLDERKNIGVVKGVFW
jgi:hypothetical protein